MDNFGVFSIPPFHPKLRIVVYDACVAIELYGWVLYKIMLQMNLPFQHDCFEYHNILHHNHSHFYHCLLYAQSYFSGELLIELSFSMLPLNGSLFKIFYRVKHL